MQYQTDLKSHRREINGGPIPLLAVLQPFSSDSSNLISRFFYWLFKGSFKDQCKFLDEIFQLIFEGSRDSFLRFLQLLFFVSFLANFGDHLRVFFFRDDSLATVLQQFLQSLHKHFSILPEFFSRMLEEILRGIFILFYFILSFFGGFFLRFFWGFLKGFVWGVFPVSTRNTLRDSTRDSLRDGDTTLTDVCSSSRRWLAVRSSRTCCSACFNCVSNSVSTSRELSWYSSSSILASSPLKQQ